MILHDERRDRIDDMEEKIIEALGEAQALQEISKALDYDTKEVIYDYIMRMWDIKA